MVLLMDKKTTQNYYLNNLKAFFDKKKVLDMSEVCLALSTMSRTTGFRYLRKLYHLTSYTHNGKFYTLPGIAQFDDDGFWHFGEIGFSIQGTLINTVHQAIIQSTAGKSNSELEKHCKAKVQTALRTLLNSKRIARVKLEKYLYVCADPSINGCQVRKRLKMESP